MHLIANQAALFRVILFLVQLLKSSHVLAPSATPWQTASAGGLNHVRGNILIILLSSSAQLVNKWIIILCHETNLCSSFQHILFLFGQLMACIHINF